ncbi:MAG: polysaccharide biosynthesis protein, partial [Clostridioides sp.]|nr:polysaccharide biosynthesis protein [Clostridioides sp.]
MKLPYLVFSTVILFISNLIVRILGFVYKIFLSNVLGEVDLGIYHMIFNFVMIALALTTTGIPTALSCLISKKNTLNDRHSTNVLFISTLYTSTFVAFIISLIISLNNSFFAQKFLNNPNLNIYILAVAPSIVIITLSNIMRGYFYGVKKIIVPAIGQVLEQISKILFVVGFIFLIGNNIYNCYIALLGISVGELANVIFMTFHIFSKYDIQRKYSINIKEFLNSSLETVKMAVPITTNRMTNIIIQSISSMIIPSRLALSGISYTKALSLYGIMSGMVMPFVMIPFTLGSALVVNLIPSIAQEIALNKKEKIKLKIYYSLLLTLIVGILSSMLFYFFGEKICLIVFKNELAGKYLKLMCIVPLFMSLNQTLLAILNALRKEVISSINTIAGTFLQLIGIYVLLPFENINMYGYIIVMSVCSM